MLWIYGGGFSGGDSATPMYNGAVLAKNQDVVVAVWCSPAVIHAPSAKDILVLQLQI